MAREGDRNCVHRTSRPCSQQQTCNKRGQWVIQPLNDHWVHWTPNAFSNSLDLAGEVVEMHMIQPLFYLQVDASSHTVSLWWPKGKVSHIIKLKWTAVWICLTQVFLWSTKSKKAYRWVKSGASHSSNGIARKCICMSYRPSLNKSPIHLATCTHTHARAHTEHCHQLLYESCSLLLCKLLFAACFHSILHRFKKDYVYTTYQWTELCDSLWYTQSRPTERRTERQKKAYTH